MKRKILLWFGGVVVLLVGLLAVSLLYLGPIIKKGVETVGPRVTQVDVKLADAQVGLLTGSGSLKGLVVGNPAGYKADAAMRLGEVSVAVEPRSLFGEKLHIRSVSILAPEIHLEGGLKENNLAQILANVQAFSGTNQTGSASTEKKLQLDSLVVRGARVIADLNVPGLPRLELTLPDIELANLGQGPEGITAAELTRQLVSQITTRTLSAVADAAARAGKAVIEGAAGVATDAAGQATKAAGGAAEKALKGVGDLFKKKN